MSSLRGVRGERRIRARLKTISPDDAASMPGKGQRQGLVGAGACQDRPMMSRCSGRRRRPSVPITSPHVARLYRLVRFLADAPRDRLAVLSELQIGLRTFYRE